MPTVCSRAMLAVVAAVVAGAGAPAGAQMTEHQVLVVYDSRITDSLLVAEHYAGSARVPNGLGGVAGAHAGVHVVNLAEIGGGLGVPAADVTFATYAASFRNPLRVYLTSAGLAKSVRSIVLTKGLPHRVQDTDAPGVGDQPTQADAEAGAGDATYASLDSELCLLWQDLETGEAGGAADSKLDGMVVNPFARSEFSIDAWSSRNIATAKRLLSVTTVGFTWRSQFLSGPLALLPGDMYLVCRLDGHTVADVRGMIDRAQNLVVDTGMVTIVLDEALSDGVQDLGADSEFDNDGAVGVTNGGDDYEQARDQLLADGRFAAANVRYNALAGAAEFLVGPRVSFGGQGALVAGPVLLLGSEGSNHRGGIPPGAGTAYADSFNYAPGAVFNTIESFNGRVFGGLGLGPVPQEQIADFIAAGGTFGIGTVWEPFSLTVGDNDPIVRAFFLGGMSWAEAAYAAIPAISWQHVVIGDPLARVRRANEDLNGDAATGVEDLYAWHTGGVRVDLNRSGAADGTDADLLEDAVRAQEQVKMKYRSRLE